MTAPKSRLRVGLFSSGEYGSSAAAPQLQSVASWAKQVNAQVWGLLLYYDKACVKGQSETS